MSIRRWEISLKIDSKLPHGRWGKTTPKREHQNNQAMPCLQPMFRKFAMQPLWKRHSCLSKKSAKFRRMLCRFQPWPSSPFCWKKQGFFSVGPLKSLEKNGKRKQGTHKKQGLELGPSSLGPSAPRVQKVSKTVCLETPETLLRLFWTLFGPQGRKAPRDSFGDSSGISGPKGPGDPCKGRAGSREPRDPDIVSDILKTVRTVNLLSAVNLLRIGSIHHVMWSFLAKIWPKNAKNYLSTWRPRTFKTSTLGITWCENF